MVDELEERALPAVETLEDVHLPERAAAVEAPREERSGGFLELREATRRGQRPAEEMVLHVEAGIVLPARVGELEGHRERSLGVAAQARETRLDALGEPPEGQRPVHHDATQPMWSGAWGRSR